MDADAKDVLGVLLKSDKVEQGPAGFDFHEQVDVALEGIISSSNGTEYAKISHAVLLGRLLKGGFAADEFARDVSRKTRQSLHWLNIDGAVHLLVY